MLRSEQECMLKWNSLQKSDPQASKWTNEEDNILVEIMRFFFFKSACILNIY